MRGAIATALAGLLLLLAAFVFDAAPLFVVGLAFTLLGGLAPSWVWLSARGATVERTLANTRVEEGRSVEALVAVRRGRLGLSEAEIHDPLVPEPVHVTLALGERSTTVRLSARFERRGPKRLEPPVLLLRDPLALARVLAPGTGPAQDLLVLPRTEAVSWGAVRGGAPRAAAHDGAGDEPPAAVDIDGLRPYRPGTPASRIHWPAYARGAGLLERRLTADGETLPLVLLDARDGGATELLDAAVRAAASLTLALAKAGGCRLLIGDARRPVVVEPDLRTWPGLHTRLALVGEEHARAPVLSQTVARGPVFYCAAQPMRRLPPALAAARGGLRALVLPRGLCGEIGQAPGFEVAGCLGFRLRAGSLRAGAEDALAT